MINLFLLVYIFFYINTKWLEISYLLELYIYFNNKFVLSIYPKARKTQFNILPYINKLFDGEDFYDALINHVIFNYKKKHKYFSVHVIIDH